MKNKNLNKYILILSLLLLFTPCGAAYSKTKEKTPKDLNVITKEQTKFMLNLEWFDVVNDDYLSGYVRDALFNNFEIRKADINLYHSNAIIGLHWQRYLPDMYLWENSTRNLYSKDSFSNGTTRNKRNSVFQPEVRVDLPLTFWKTHKKNELEDTDRETVLYDRLNTVLTVVSDVTATYYNVLLTDRLIENQEQLVNNLQEQSGIKSKDMELGLLPRTDFLAQEIFKKLNIEKNELCVLKGQRKSYVLHLNYLTGKPDTYTTTRESFQNHDYYKRLVPEYLSSRIAYNRPDVLKAQSQLKEAKINIDIAKQAFFPDIKLFGEFGYKSFDWRELFMRSKAVYTVGNNLEQVLFDAGEKRANLIDQKYNYESLLENYRDKLYKGISDIERWLYIVKKQDLPGLDCKEETVKNAVESAKRANFDYENGLISRFDYLNNEEELFRANKDYLTLNGDFISHLVTLFAEAGGNFGKGQDM